MPAFGWREFIELAFPIARQRSSTVLAADLAENGFELGEDLFDGIEIGPVGRQVERGCADRLNGLVYAGDLVGGEVVHDDDVARGQGRRGLFEAWTQRKEACAVDRAIELAAMSGRRYSARKERA